MKSQEKSKAIGITITLISAVLWGFSGTCGQYLFTNYGVGAEWLTAVRMLTAGIILCAVGFKVEKASMLGIWKNKQDTISLLIFSVAGLMFCQLTYMKAIAYSNSGTATILQYLGPVLIMIIHCVMSKVPPKKKELAAITLALVGTFILATHGDIHSMVITGKGLTWGLLSALGLTLYTMLPGSIITRWGSITVTGYGLIIGGAILGLYEKIWLVQVVLDVKALAAMGGIIIFGTVLAFSMYLYGVKAVGAVKASMLASIEPLSATIFMVLWLRSPFTWIDAVGFACILTTVFLLTKKERDSSLETPSLSDSV